MANNSGNVMAGKPKVGGAVYLAPAGTALPTDSTTALDEAYVCLGYCSEDGVTNANTPSTDTIRAWGGDPVLTILTEKEDTFSMTLIEAMNVDVLKAVYGSENVTGTLAAGITVKANANCLETGVWVIEMITRNGGTHRVVIPVGTVSELGEISYTDSDAVGFEITVSAAADTSGNTHYEYIKETAA